MSEEKSSGNGSLSSNSRFDGFKAMMSSTHMDWATPSYLYEQLNSEFGFTIDVCASDWNAKHERYWTVQDDALSKDWSGEKCFMNPPYGRGIKRWVRKAYEESLKGALVVGIIPSRTDTSYWHDYIEGKAEVRFIRGRVRFVRPNSKLENAPFASAIIVWRPKEGGLNVL